MQQFFLPLYNYKISFPKSVRLVIMKVIVTSNNNLPNYFKSKYRSKKIITNLQFAN